MIEGWLTALLVPGHIGDKIAGRQAIPLGQIANMLVVPYLIRRLEKRIDDAVDNAQTKKADQYAGKRGVPTHKIYAIVHHSTHMLTLLQGEYHRHFGIDSNPLAEVHYRSAGQEHCTFLARRQETPLNHMTTGEAFGLKGLVLMEREYK